MSTARPEPWTTYLRFDETSTMRRFRDVDRFSIIRVETTGRLADAVHKSSHVPALLVSMSLRTIAAPHFRLWVDGKLVPTAKIPAFRTNLIDLAAEPSMWADAGIHYAHFHLRRSAIDDTAADLGFEPVGGFRQVLVEQDIVLAQITKSVLPYLGADAATSPLALDHLELIVAAHVMQRYGAPRHVRAAVTPGLAPWQCRRVTEMLREHLDGRIRLADLARSCNLSVSHFARSFKSSFGVTCHRWLTKRRLDHAKHLLARTAIPLSEVATQSGFGDQASFTRSFRRFVGVTPGHWRREHAGD
jgi:AraC family transcriptional regulator